MRWVRLIFGREFHIEDVFVIWDAIFADIKENDEAISTLEYMSVSMLMYIREFMLSRYELLFACLCVLFAVKIEMHNLV